MNKFWESLGGNLASEWLRRAFSPAFLFWLAGLGFYMQRYGWQGLWNWLQQRTSAEQIALLVLLLLGLILSSLLTSRWRFAMLRWMEGYWPWPIIFIGRPLARWQAYRLSQAEKALNALMEKSGPLPFDQVRRRGELELFTHYFPADPSEILPTRLGNILRAGETAPTSKYGLDAFVCWPRLWPLLPDTLRKDLETVYERMLTLAEIWEAGLLTACWVAFSWWALPLALVWTALAYRLLIPVAMTYADLLETAFDLYRRKLYETIGWPLPNVGEEEIEAGKRLSEFFWRGTL